MEGVIHKLILKNAYISNSDEFELEFSGSSRAELWRFRAEPSWGTSIFELKPSWNFFTLTYQINAQDGISKYWGQNFFLIAWKKGFYYIEINEQGGQKLKNQ